MRPMMTPGKFSLPALLFKMLCRPAFPTVLARVAVMFTLILMIALPPLVLLRCSMALATMSQSENRGR